MSADQERTPLAVQYGSARETSQGMGRDGVWSLGIGVWGVLRARGVTSLPCADDGQSSVGVAVRPPQS